MPPSPLLLLGLVQHMADFERNCFRRVLVGDSVGLIYDPTADRSGHDGGFVVASRGLEDTSPLRAPQ